MKLCRKLLLVALCLISSVAMAPSPISAEEKVKEVVVNTSKVTAASLTITGRRVFPYSDYAGTVVALANEDTHPFLRFGKAIKYNPKYLSKRYEKSLEKFYSVRDCLKKTERSKQRPDLSQIDWSSINNEEDANVCLFRIASSYDSPESMKAWFVRGGFETTLDDKAFFSAEYVSKRIWASWNVREQGLRFWSNPLSWGYKRLIVRKIAISVRYDNSNMLFDVHTGYNHIFNT